MRKLGYETVNPEVSGTAGRRTVGLVWCDYKNGTLGKKHNHLIRSVLKDSVKYDSIK